MSTDFVLHCFPDGDVLDAARDCEASVFLDRYGNTAQQWAEEYGPYDDYSSFLAITEPGGDAVATMRLIVPSVAGLKSLVDVSREPWQVDGVRAARAAAMSVDQTWDVATLAIRRGSGGGGMLSAALFHGLLRASRANAARWIVMIMDLRARRLLNAVGLHTHVLPGTTTAPYLGSTASVPLWAEVGPMVDEQRRVNPDSYRFVSLGIGLDNVSIPGPAAFVRPPVAATVQAVDSAARLSAGRASA